MKLGELVTQAGDSVLLVDILGGLDVLDLVEEHVGHFLVEAADPAPLETHLLTARQATRQLETDNTRSVQTYTTRQKCR